MRSWGAAWRTAGAGARTDLNQTVRSLVRQPRHVVTVVVCLGVGITVSVASVNQSARAGGLAHSRLRHSLVVAQIAGSLVLLVVAGLFGQSVRAMRAAAPAGLAEQLVASFDLERLSYSQADVRRLLDELGAKVSADTRVRSVAAEFMSGFRYRSLDAAPGERRQD